MALEPTHEDLTVLRAENATLKAQVEKAELKAKTHERDWYEAKSEFGTASAKLRAALREAQTDRDRLRVELDGIRNRLQTIADKAFGPFAVESAQRLLTAIETGITVLRLQVSEMARAQNPSESGQCVDLSRVSDAELGAALPGSEERGPMVQLFGANAVRQWLIQKAGVKA